MERLEYKGYLGSIEFNRADNCLHGQVLGLNKKICIIYEGHTTEELYNDFKEGIEHYLDDCKEDGIHPEADGAFKKQKLFTLSDLGAFNAGKKVKEVRQCLLEKM